MNNVEWQLINVKKEKLAEWWNLLNSWQWPEDFPFRKPDNWDNLDNYNWNPLVESKYNIIRLYKGVIEKFAGYKECLRWHHIHNIKMKNYQFEIWWLFNNINGFFQEFNPSFYIDIYRILKWEGR